MKEKVKNISPDPKELPPLKKRGTCIYIQDVFVIAEILKSLFDIIEKGKTGSGRKISSEKSRKLSQQEATKIMKEVASYIYFETVKQIWEYSEGDLSENDARKVLDTVSSYVFYSYGIDNLPEKLEEYQRAENPILQVSRNLQKILRKNHGDMAEAVEIATIITGITTHTLFEGIGRMFKLSEKQMAELIEDFFVNYYPRFTKK